MKNIGKIIGGGFCSAIAVSAALTTMYMNAAHGLMAIGGATVVIAILKVTCDGGRIVMMLLHGFGHKHKLIWPSLIIFGAISLMSALAYYADSTADKILSAETGNAKSARADGDYKRIEDELVRITETMPAISLKPLVAQAQATLGDAEKAAQKGGVKCVEQKRCREAQATLVSLTERLGQASRKAELEASFTQAKSAVNEAPKTKMSGIALLLVKLAGMDETKTALWVELGMNIALIVAAEFAVYVGLIGFPMLAIGLGMIEVVVEEIEEIIAPAPVIQLAEKREEEVLQRFVSMILRAEDGGICVSGRELARRLDVPHSTFSTWLVRWLDTGKIAATPVSAHKKRFTVAA